MAPRKPPGPPPTAARLRDAALLYLGRYAATRGGLLRVLHRRIDRWAREAAAEPDTVATAKAAAAAVVAALAEAGAVDDEAFAASRARSLTRAGRSRRAIAAHLAARGVSGDLAAASLPDDPAAELGAALAYVRSRRMGAFRSPPDPAQRLRDLGRLARAGFPQGVATRALDTDPAEAEAAIIRLRQS